MSSFTRWAFGNKAAISVLTVLILVMGIISYFRLPMEFLPSADNPQVTIITMGHGTDSKTMEMEATTPIEKAVSGLNGKSSVYSRTGDGYSLVDIVYEAGYDMKQAKQEVQEAVASISFPSNIGKPTVSQLHTSMIPIINIAVTFENGLTEENLAFATNEIKARYQAVNGVSIVDVYGITESIISVDVKEEKLAEYGIPLTSLMGILQGQNAAISVAEQNIENKLSNIKVIGDLTSVEKLKELALTPEITLGDIATIKETVDSNYTSRLNGKDAIDISIMKDEHSNAVTISKEVEKVTKEMNKQFPNQEAVIYVSSSDIVQNSVHTMMKEVLLGALFATIVIMVFYEISALLLSQLSLSPFLYV